MPPSSSYHHPYGLPPHRSAPRRSVSPTQSRSAPPPLQWGFGSSRAPKGGTSFERPVGGLAGIAQLTASPLVVHATPDSGASPDAASELAHAVRDCERMRAFAEHALHDSDAKLCEIFRSAEQRLPAKAVLLSASKAIVRLSRATAALERASERSERDHHEAVRSLFGEKEAYHTLLTADLWALEARLGSAHSALSERSMTAAELSKTVDRLSAELSVRGWHVELSKGEIRDLEAAQACMMGLLETLGNRVSDDALRVRELQLLVAQHERRIELLRAELSEMEGTMEGVESNASWSITSLLAELDSERSRSAADRAQSTRQYYELRNEVDELRTRLGVMSAAHSSAQAKLDTSTMELARVRSDWAVAETAAKQREEQTNQQCRAQLLVSAWRAARKEAAWRRREAHLTQSMEAARAAATAKEAELALDVERQRATASEYEAELASKLERGRAVAAEHAAELNKSLEQRLAGAMRLRLREVQWRRKEQALNESLEATREAAAEEAAALHREIEEQRLAASDRHTLLEQKIESERALAAEKLADFQRSLESQKAEAEAQMAGKDASWRHKELELNRLLESVRAEAAGKESELLRSAEMARQAAAAREAELGHLLERERAVSAEHAAGLKRSLETQRMASATAEAELQQSMTQQRLAAESREAELTRTLEAVRAQATSKETGLTRELARQRAEAVETEAELNLRRERETTSAAEQLEQLHRELERLRLAAAATEADLQQEMETQRVRAEAAEHELRSELEETRQLAVTTETELQQQVETTDANARQLVATLSRQLRELEAEQMVELNEVKEELEREREERNQLEDKLLQTATKLQAAKQEAATLEERKMEVVRREMGLSRQLKDSKAREEELTAMVASERVKRQQSESSLAQEIGRLNQAWREASAQKLDGSASLTLASPAVVR